MKQAVSPVRELSAAAKTCMALLHHSGQLDLIAIVLGHRCLSWVGLSLLPSLSSLHAPSSLITAHLQGRELSDQTQYLQRKSTIDFFFN